MKIAIMTQPLGHNYGGIMQAWALQQVLIKAGHEVVTIDRQLNDRGFLYGIVRTLYRSIMKFSGKRKAPINFEKNYPYIFSNTRKFIKENIVMSEPLDSTKKLKAHFEREKYEAVIVGSDQTWRPAYSPDIANFFLDFLVGKDIKRIAYASSFGVDEWEFSDIQTKSFSEFARLFDGISVREDSGVDLCQKYLGVNAEHVLDPTLLIAKKQYEDLAGNNRIKSYDEGIYTYFLDSTPNKSALAKRFSEEAGEPLYCCQALYSTSDDLDVDVDDYVMPDPRDWIAGFANAKYVITDSFHGVVFSILFNKPFIVINNATRGSARFKSLLKLIGRESNIFPENIDVKRNIVDLFGTAGSVDSSDIGASKKFLFGNLNAS